MDPHTAALLTASIAFCLQAAAGGADGLDVALVDLGDGLAGVLGAVAVHVHEAGEVKLGGLDDLHLADEHVLHGEGALNGLDDLLGNAASDQLLEELLHVALVHLLGDGVHEGLADGADLRALCVRGLLDLVGLLLGEANAEHAHGVAVSGLDVNVCLDQGLELADERAQLVAGEVHAVEVAQHSGTLHLLADQADLAESGVLCLLVQVSQGDLEHAALELLRGDLGANGLGHRRLAAQAVLEDGGHLDVIPVLLGEGVDDLLLGALAALAQLLVLANCHG